MVFIADDLLYYYNDSRLIKKGNNLAANSHKDNYYKGREGGGVMQSVIQIFINRMRG